MRFRNGFSLEELRAACAALLIDSNPMPGPTRHFFFLVDPDRACAEPSASVTVVGEGCRLETRAGIRAGLILAEPGLSGLPSETPVLHVRNARQAVAALVNAFASRIEPDAVPAAGTGNTVHPSAVVEGVLGGGVVIDAGARVGAGCFIGSGSHIGANAVIEGDCRVGARAVIQAGAVIGCAGFGFFPAAAGLEAMPHLAGVRIGADCFIGANTVIAAGVLHPTEIGDGCKLDSHVQIAHNVRLGKDCLLASQSGVAGSTIIGDNLRMGGAASIAGHLRLGDDVSVAAKSGVTKDAPDGATVAGFPARPIAEWRRTQAAAARAGRA